MTVTDKVIVVTGGGSGIGRELVLQLVDRGAQVAAVDINEAALQETLETSGLHQDNISTHILDVSDREAVAALPRAIANEHGAVDGLINNAGVIQPFVRLNDLEYEDIDRVLNINFYGVLHTTKAFLPHLLDRPEAHIVNVSSMGGFFPVPGQTLYGASKAAVKLLTEGLYSELTDTSVAVTAVFPGAVSTNIAANSGVSTEAGATEKSKRAPGTTSPEDAAGKIIGGMEENKFHVYIGTDSTLMNILYRISPKWATRFMFNRMKGLLPDV